MFTVEFLIMEKSKKIILFDIDNTLFDTLLFKKSDLQTFSVYQEAYEVLDELSKIAELGIFSEGDVAFQKEKLRQTNIEKYFLKEHTHILSQKVTELEQVLKKYKDHKKLFLVDDRLEILAIIKKDFPSVFGIWIKRGEYAPTQIPIKGFTPDATVDTLKEIIPLVINR